MTRSNVMKTALPLWLGLASLAACDLPALEPDCEGVRPIVGALTQGPTDEPVRGALVVRGRAEHPDGLAIRAVEVAGILAANGDSGAVVGGGVDLNGDGLPDDAAATTGGGFNYSVWQAIVPFDQLQTLALQQGTPDRAEIVVVATDVCDQATRLETFQVVLDEQPEIQVTDLDLEVTLPDPSRAYLPTEGSISGLVTVTANAEAAGAEVELATSVGQLSSASGAGSGDALTLTLLGDGEAGGVASASAFITSNDEGTALLTATSGGLLGQATLTFSGPPILSPSQATIEAGETLEFAVLTDGVLSRCLVQATPPEVQVSAPEGEGGGDTVTITVDDMLASEAEFDVTCLDVYNQSGSGTYTARPAPEQP